MSASTAPKRAPSNWRAVGTLAGGLACPTTAWAEVCATLRPDWDESPTHALGEAIYLSGTLPVLLLLAASAVAILLRSQWGGLAVIVLWTILASYIILDGDETVATAIQEGCRGAPSLFVAMVAAICVAIVLKTLPRPKTDTQRDTENGDE